MNAVNQGIAVLCRAQAMTDYGDVYLESVHEEAVRSVVQALNEYDRLAKQCFDLREQRDALLARVRREVSDG